MNKEKLKFKLKEDLQEAIIESGGRFFRMKEIEEMKVSMLFDIIINNGIFIDSRSTEQCELDVLEKNKELFVRVAKYAKNYQSSNDTELAVHQFIRKIKKDNEKS